MSITGNLRTMELSELLQWLATGAKTGTLVVGHSGVQKRIFFDKGNVIATASTDPKEHLGHFLVSRGYIDEEALAQAISMQDANKMLLGKILVTIGAISEPDLDELLRLKSEETIYEIFTWEEGEFRFLDDVLPQFAMVPLTIHLNKIVLEGVHRIDEWRRLHSLIPSDQAVAVAVGELDPESDDSMATKILGYVNDERTVAEIVLQAHASEYHVFRVLFGQVNKQRLKLVQPRRMRDEEEESADEGPVGTSSLLAKGKALLEEDDYQAALRHYRAALSLEPNNQEIRAEVEKAERSIHKMLESQGVSGTAVPELAQSIGDLSTVDLSPEEGFILSRINNTYDIQTIVKISPMGSLDALLVFRRLARAGHIKLHEQEDGGHHTKYRE